LSQPSKRVAGEHYAKPANLKKISTEFFNRNSSPIAKSYVTLREEQLSTKGQKIYGLMPLRGGTKSALDEGARARESYPRTGASSNFANFPLVRGSGTSSIFMTALPSLLSSSMCPRPKIVGTIRRVQPLLDTQSAKVRQMDNWGMSCESKLSKKRRRSSPALVKCSY
jgi:hypothetical protein